MQSSFSASAPAGSHELQLAAVTDEDLADFLATDFNSDSHRSILSTAAVAQPDAETEQQQQQQEA